MYNEAVIHNPGFLPLGELWTLIIYIYANLLTPTCVSFILNLFVQETILDWGH